MAQIAFRIDFDDRALQAAFRLLTAAAADMTDLFSEIGEYLGEVHKARWQEGIDSLGFAWAELTEATWARKKGPSILHETETMLQGSVYQASAHELLFGPTDHQVPGHSLAAIHHFGVTKNNLPAREILGLNDTDRAEIMKLVELYIMEAANSR